MEKALVIEPVLAAFVDRFEARLSAANALSDLPQVIVTPHLGGGSRNSMATVVARFTDNINRFLAGEPLRALLPE